MRDWPPWLINIAVPFTFGAGLAIPFVIAISDKAAEFAGGFSAAIAAVIAVVFTGWVNDRNEKAKEDRVENTAVRAAVQEIGLFLVLSGNEAMALLGSMKEFVDHPDTQVTNIEMWRLFMAKATEPIPTRLVSLVGRFPREVASEIYKYDRLAIALRQGFEMLTAGATTMTVVTAKAFIPATDILTQTTQAAAIAVNKHLTDAFQKAI